MAHEVENMFSVGEPAWHGLGTVLDNPPTIAEAIVAAGLNWNVKKTEIVIKENNETIPYYATVRDGGFKSTFLGIVGANFTPLQNKDAFTWFQPFLDSGVASLESAGSLREGKRVWILARNKAAETEIVKGDVVRQYILLAHGHDGSLATRVGFTSVRVVCNNTLNMSMNDKASKLLKIKHTQGLMKSLEKVQDVISLATKSFNATNEQFRQLARTGCDLVTLQKYVTRVFTNEKNEITGDDQDAGKRIIAKILPLFEFGMGAEYSKGTMWGAYNSVTEYITHLQGKNAERRLESQWFGANSNIINKALKIATEFATA